VVRISGTDQVRVFGTRTTGAIKLVVGRDSNTHPSASWNLGASHNSLYVFGRF
jgi:hypothetical protein